MAKRRSPRDDLDQVDEAGRESFPASDPPAWVSVRAGAPAAITEQLRSNDAARDVWNTAVEAAARVIQRAPDGRSRDQLCADVRAIKAD